MSNRTLSLNEPLYEYLLSVSVREPALLRRLREETARDPMAQMQIAPEQGQFLALLARMLGARRTIEVGVFTGYSSLCVARVLPEDGKLIACDKSKEWTDVARRYWQEAGVEDKIDLRLAPAIETLDGLIEDSGEAQYDFAFIDADKSGYPAYFERCLTLLRGGGVIAVDNTLWDGKVADATDASEDTAAIRAFNNALYADERIELSLVPIGDGLTLALKR